MGVKKKTAFRSTTGWEAEARNAATAAERAVRKGAQQGQFTFGNPWDITSVAARLRRAADALETLDRTLEVPTSETRNDLPREGS